MTIQTMNERIEEFRSRVQDMYDADYQANYPMLKSPSIEVEMGRKNAKIVIQQLNKDGTPQHGRSVYCFIDLSTGDILKAAGWKAPAKGKRGSIWNEDCDVGPNKPANVHGGGLYK